MAVIAINHRMKFKLTSLLFPALILMASCSSVETDSKNYPKDSEDARRAKNGKLLGEDGLNLFGTGKEDDKKGNGLGVNSFLWRASLDTLSFMPITQADPFGGVILTDWYEDPAAKGERFKINVLILDTTLRADGIRVSVFKQSQKGAGWQDVKTGPEVARDIENKILTRARELRLSRGK